MTKILIVDEDNDVLRLLRIKLAGAGYEVIQARDGREALALAEIEQPDLVITEILLPDIDGIDLIARLGAVGKSLSLTLVLSDKTGDDDIAAALSAGAVDYVTKPFSPQGLLERIRINLIRVGLAEAAFADPTGQRG
jgi:DNA-binding response OmpR family regulator